MTEPRVSKLNLIVEALERADHTGLTRKDIAAVLGIKKSPYLIELIQQILDSGWATAEMKLNSYPPKWKYHYQNAEILELKD